MAYNHSKVLDDLKISHVFASHTSGEYIQKLAAHLFDANDEIAALNRTNGDRLIAQQNSERQLAAEAAAHRETRSKLEAEIGVLRAHKGAFELALNAIAKDSRGAKKLAADALAAVNAPADPAAQPATTEAAK